MTASRSDTLFLEHNKSQEQFDYFIVAIISGVVSYLGQHFIVSRFTSPSYDISVAAIISLLLSLYCGFMRIETSLVCKRLNAKLLHFAETKGKLMESFQSITTATFLNAATGEVVTREQARSEIARFTDEIPKGNIALTKTSENSLLYYKLRNRLFLFGFVAMIVSRILSPYIG